MSEKKIVLEACVTIVESFHVFSVVSALTLSAVNRLRYEFQSSAPVVQQVMSGRQDGRSFSWLICPEISCADIRTHSDRREWPSLPV